MDNQSELGIEAGGTDRHYRKTCGGKEVCFIPGLAGNLCPLYLGDGHRFGMGVDRLLCAMVVFVFG